MESHFSALPLRFSVARATQGQTGAPEEDAADVHQQERERQSYGHGVTLHHVFIMHLHAYIYISIYIYTECM